MTGTFDERSSDVDFIITFADMSPGIANRYVEVAEELQQLLDRPVDVKFGDRPIAKPYLRKTVEAGRANVSERSARQNTA